MELDQRVDSDERRIDKMRRALTRILTAPSDKMLSVTRTLPRQARMFTTKTTVDFSRAQPTTRRSSNCVPRTDPAC